MALTLSNSISGQFDPSESSGFFVYALRRDADDMLLFSKVSAASTELGEFYRNDGTAIPEFGDGLIMVVMMLVLVKHQLFVMILQLRKNL